MFDVMRNRFGWVCYLEQAPNNFWRIKTGTFKGQVAANKAAEKIKKANISSVVHIMKA